MYLIYFDSAGNTGRNLDDPQQPFHTTSAVILEHSKWQIVNSDFIQVLDAYVPARNKDDFEIHTADLYNGHDVWQGRSFADRKTLILDLLDIIVKHDIKICYYTLKKPVYKKWQEDNAMKGIQHPCWMGMFTIIQMVEKYLRSKGAGALGMLIGDKEKDIEEDLHRYLMRYKSPDYAKFLDDLKKENRDTGTVVVERIIDTIHFVDSHKTSILQLADLAAYFINKYYLKGQNPSPYLKIIEGNIADKGEMLK
jgi:Protein of unknown function (DUF3800)